MALGRKTGGRQKGACNRATAEARAAAEATGILPLDYMLSVMRDANAEPKRRDAMAMAAAPYLHPRLSAIEPKSNEPAGAEVHGIRVVFVRPRPRHEDDEGVAIENSPTLQSRIRSGGHHSRETYYAYRRELMNAGAAWAPAASRQRHPAHEQGRLMKALCISWLAITAA